jgi:hypothetical protein
MVHPRSDRRTILAAIVLLAIFFVPVVVVASDHAINIAAVDLVPSNNSVTYTRNPANQGNLQSPSGIFYANVPASHFGRVVCSFSMYLRDVDAALDATARLLKKNPTASAFTAPTEMASVSSSGAVDDVSTFTTTSINSPEVTAGLFYFVELTLPFGNTMQALGLRIVYRSSC